MKHFKNRRLNTLFYCTFFIISLSLQSNVSADSPLTAPHSNWHDLESKHFHILHDKKDLKVAQQSVKIAEAAFNQLSKLFKYTPKKKIYLSLVNSMDFTNGTAEIAPKDRVFILMTPPTSDTLLSTANWYENVITHELVHIFHLNQTSGLSKLLNQTFGKSYFFSPQIWQPNWVIEGLATYLETTYINNTRTASIAYENLMANEVKKGLRSFATVNAGDNMHWPYGTAYLYGSYFFLFLEENYGRESIIQMVNNYSSNSIPFLIKSNTIPATGKPLNVLWDEFHTWLNIRFSDAKIAKATSTSHTKVSASNDLVETPIISNGKLYYHQFNRYKHDQIIEQTLNTNGSTKKRSLAKFGAKLLDVHDQSGILLSKITPCSSSHYLSDLYVLSPSTKQLQRISHCARYYNATWSADGQQIATFKNHGAFSSIELLNKQGKHLKTLVSGKVGDDTQWISIDWSNDNKRLLLTRKISNKFLLQEFNLQTQQWATLKSDTDIKTSATYTPDDSAIIYTAEHASRFTEVFKLNRKSKHLIKLTNYQGITYQATLDKETKQLYFIGVSPTGPTIYSASLEQQKANGQLSKKFKRKLASKPKTINLNIANTTVQSKLKPYNPLSTLAPSGWSPTLINTKAHSEYGVFLTGNDILDQHKWQAGLAYSPDLKETTFGLGYIYDGWLELGVNRSIDEVNFKDKEHTKLNRYNRETLSKLRASHTFRQPMSSFLVGLSVGNLNTQKLVARPNLKGKKLDTSNQGIVGVDFTYNTAGVFQSTLGLNDGRNLKFSIESYDVFNKSTNASSTATTASTGNVYQFKWNEYITLGKTTLAFNNTVALSKGGSNPSKLKLGGNSVEFGGINNIDMAFARRDFRLRGYNNKAFSGTRLHTATVTWQAPVWNINKTASTPPIGIGKIGINLFAETGKVWDKGKTTDYKHAVGAELRSELQLGYNFIMPVNVGIAKGLDKQDGKVEPYVDFKFSF